MSNISGPINGQSTTSVATSASVITILGKYLTSASAITGYASIAHSHHLSAIQDVSIGTKADSQVIAYSSSQSQWVNRQLNNNDVSNVAAVAIVATTVDWALGNTFIKSIANTTTAFTFTNTVDGKTIVVGITASAGTVTFTSVLWPASTAPTQTANKTDIYTFIRLGANVYGNAVQAF